LRRFGSDRAAGIMGKLGMDDETPIESGMVSNFIESAQAKVEGFNFDIRKNVVEYDDVIAAQRAVVYADREAVLRQEDMHERCLDFIEGEVRRVVSAHTTGNLPEEWDLDGLVKVFDSWHVAVPDDVFPEYINKLRRETLTTRLVEVAHAGFARKEEQVKAAVEKASADGMTLESGEFYMRQFERMVILHVLDSLWRDHIDHLDVLRSGIQLRGVAQRDPLVEFKREAFQEFETVKGEMEQQIAELLFKADVRIQVQLPPPETDVAKLKTNSEAIAQASGQAKGAGVAAAKPRPALAAPAQGANFAAAAAAVTGRQSGQATQNRANGANGSGVPQRGPNAGNGHGQRPLSGQAKGAMRPQQRTQVGATAGPRAAESGAQAKLGRNDQCYCGSGRKFKNCHGR
jgi:preprotein translocase subunit SecA